MKWIYLLMHWTNNNGSWWYINNIYLFQQQLIWSLNNTSQSKSTSPSFDWESKVIKNLLEKRFLNIKIVVFVKMLVSLFHNCLKLQKNEYHFHLDSFRFRWNRSLHNHQYSKWKYFEKLNLSWLCCTRQLKTKIDYKKCFNFATFEKLLV